MRRVSVWCCAFFLALLIVADGARTGARAESPLLRDQSVINLINDLNREYRYLAALKCEKRPSNIVIQKSEREIARLNTELQAKISLYANIMAEDAERSASAAFKAANPGAANLEENAKEVGRQARDTSLNKTR